jgi:hypothetical protein
MPDEIFDHVDKFTYKEGDLDIELGTGNGKKLIPAGEFAEKKVTVGRLVPLPPPVARIYEAVRELREQYPDSGRTFTPDGHLVGSIGEVIAAEALGLTLYKNSHPGHDAHDGKGGDVQIKMTAGNSVAMYATSVRLVVLKVVSPKEAEIVYDGPGAPVWEGARMEGKNGQRVVSLSRLREIAASASSQISD